MATRLGLHAERLKALRALRSARGRRDAGRFLFEGATLLAEAVAAGFALDEVYATQQVYDATPLLQDLDRRGLPTFIVDPAAAARISDLETPSGLVAVAPARLCSVAEALEAGAPALVLADLADPANAGTLLRSADAFGSGAAVFGSLGVEPYHPKVVRGSMGGVFRLRLAVGEPEEVAAAAAAAGAALLGLAAAGTPIEEEPWTARSALVVGHERRGLGRWEALCMRLVGIPMAGAAESLSAGVAGSIALYRATRGASCQESPRSPKSQDYRG